MTSLSPGDIIQVIGNTGANVIVPNASNIIATNPIMNNGDYFKIMILGQYGLANNIMVYAGIEINGTAGDGVVATVKITKCNELYNEGNKFFISGSSAD